METNETPVLSEIIKNAIDARLLDLHVAMPAKIETYDYNTQKASVLPLLKKKYKLNGGTEIILPIIPDVPVCWPNANNGNAYLHMPIKAGDLGLIVCCERSIDNWLSGQGNPASTSDPRHHNLSDAIFIPGVRPFGISLENTSADNVILKNSISKLELHPDGKRISSGGNMTVTLNPDGTLTIQGATNELLTVIDSWMNNIINNGYMLTAFGVSYWLDYTKALLNIDRTNLQTLMP